MDTNMYEMICKGVVDMMDMAGYGWRLLDVLDVGGYELILGIRMGMDRQICMNEYIYIYIYEANGYDGCGWIRVDQDGHWT